MLRNHFIMCPLFANIRTALIQVLSANDDSRGVRRKCTRLSHHPFVYISELEVSQLNYANPIISIDKHRRLERMLMNKFWRTRTPRHIIN